MYYYKKVIDKQIVSVEAKSHASRSPHFIKSTKEEYDTFITSLPEPEPPEPVRDLAAEIDELKARMDNIKKLKQ